MDQYQVEILEQANAIERLSQSWNTDIALRKLGADYRAEQPPLVFVGMGSSHYAPIVIRSRMAQAHMNYQILEAGELYHYEMASIPRDAWVIAISQSGESIETRKVVESLQGQVAKIITITNEKGSALDRLADHTLLLYAGKELGSTTKTFVNTLLSLHLLIDVFTDAPLLQTDLIVDLVTFFTEMPEFLRVEMKKVMEYLLITQEKTPEPIHIIARGEMISTAYQAALILAETTDLFVDAMPGGTFRHGPKELASPHHRALILAPSGKTQSLLIDLAKELHELGSHVVLISDTALNLPFYQVSMPSLPESLAPLLYFLPIEWFSWNTAIYRGRTPGMMEKMNKITTIE